MTNFIKYGLIFAVIVSLFLGGYYFYKHSYRSFLVESMIDPSSVMFRNENFSADNEYLCGEINAKNRLGAYTGFEKFIANKNGYYIQSGQIVGKDIPRFGSAYFKVALHAKLTQGGVIDLGSNSFDAAWKAFCMSDK